MLTQNGENQKNNTHWTIVYLRKGIGMYMLDSDLRCLNEGDLFVIPPKVSFSFAAAELGDEYNESVDAVVLRFDEAWLNALLSIFKTLNKVVLKVREVDAPYAVIGPKWMKMSRLLSDLKDNGSSNEPLNMLALLDLLSSKKDLVRIHPIASCEGQTVSEKLDMIDRYITSNVYGKVSLEDVSKYVGMNRTYFCLFFKKHYGKGFADYLNDMRIEKAISLLSLPGKSIADVARECGFKTAPYFTRAFIRSKGITPCDYRKKLK